MCKLSEFAELAIADRTKFAHFHNLYIIKRCIKPPDNLPRDLLHKRIAMVWIMLDDNSALKWWSGTVVSYSKKKAYVKWDGEKGVRPTIFSKKNYSINPFARAGSWFIIEK